jgi:hypothetical protein
MAYQLKPVGFALGELVGLRMVENSGLEFGVNGLELLKSGFLGRHVGGSGYQGYLEGE